MTTSIYFPHLHIYLENVGKTIMVGSFGIALYGIVIACGMIAGILMAIHEAKRTGQKPDDYLDLAIIAIICSIIGARIYYVVFSWDYYKDHLGHIFNLREGGLAIYGGVIAAIITTYVFTKVKKMNFALVTDTACLGLILGQIIGRWGNFFNREAFGGYTDGLFAMQLPVDAVRASDITEELRQHIIQINGIDYIQVHPTFLYESLWNLALLILLLLWRKHKRFDGEIFLLYLLGYGVGRFWIEALRTDQLLIGGTDLPVSRVLAAVLVMISIVLLVINWKKTQSSTKKS
ncbi:MAG: prolipoprotein diacylglyceryl transferase [Roseburia sp.]